MKNLREKLRRAVETDSVAYFEKLLPYAKSLDIALAIREAVDKNKTSVLLFVAQTEHQKTLGSCLSIACKRENRQTIDFLIPFASTYDILQGVLEASRLKNEIIFEKLYAMVSDQITLKSLERPASYPYKEEDFAMLRSRVKADFEKDLLLKELGGVNPVRPRTRKI